MIPHLHTFKWKLEQVCYSCGLYFCVSMLLLRDNCFACRVNSRQLIFFRIVDILINGDLSQWEYFDNVKRVLFISIEFAIISDLSNCTVIIYYLHLHFSKKRTTKLPSISVHLFCWAISFWIHYKFLFEECEHILY